MKSRATLIHVGAALLTGCLYFGAFPGKDGRAWWPLAFVALVPLVLVVERATPRRAFALGAVAGATMNILGFWWLVPLLEKFSGFPSAVCALLLFALAGAHSLRTALPCWLTARAARNGWPFAPSFALAFAAGELVIPAVFRWNYAATVSSVTRLIQLADLGGPILIGVVLVASNLAIAEAINARVSKRSASRTMLIVGVAAPLLALLYGFVRVSSIEASMASATPLKVGIVQGNAPLFGSAEDELKSLFTQLNHHRALVRANAGLIVWSEGSMPGSINAEHVEDQLLTQLGASKAASIIGAILVDPAKGRAWNSALALDNGHLVGRYDKRILLPFSEYIPGGEQFPSLYELSPMSGHFTPGDSLKPVMIDGHSVSIAICYEDVLPSLVASLVHEGHPELLVNLTNDTWFGDSAEPWIHLALARMRAVEHRRYLVRATNSGVSAVIDPAGRTVAQGKMFADDSFVTDAHWMTNTTLFSLVGEWPWYGAVVLCVWMAARRPKVRSSAPS